MKKPTKKIQELLSENKQLKEVKDEYYDSYKKYKDKWDGLKDWLWLVAILTFLSGIGLGVVLNSFSPSLPSSINQQALVKEYISFYYPEYKNCDIKYDGHNYVNVYCPNQCRDSLYIKKEEPIIIYFDNDLNVYKMFERKIEPCIKGVKK